MLSKKGDIIPALLGNRPLRIIKTSTRVDGYFFDDASEGSWNWVMILQQSPTNKELLYPFLTHLERVLGIIPWHRCISDTFRSGAGWQQDIFFLSHHFWAPRLSMDQKKQIGGGPFRDLGLAGQAQKKEPRWED